MATKKKPTADKKSKQGKPKLKALKGGQENHENGTEDLSEFQDTEKTGRTKKTKEDDKPKIPIPKTAHEDISKVKLDKKGFLSITYSSIQSDGSSRDRMDKWHNRRIHPDLQAAMDELKPHLALLCGYLTTQLLKGIDSYDGDKIDEFTVRGFTIGPHTEWFIISGFGKNFADQAVILNTPKQLTETENPYRFIDHLEEKINAVLEEVKYYVDGTKVGDAQQTEMEFPAASDEEEKEMEENFAEEGL